MRKKLWIILALLFVIPGLLFTVSCAKKTVKDETALQQQAEEEARIKAREAEQTERQRRMEEERLQEEARRKMMAAQNRFLNEDIHFEFDRSNLLPEAQEILRWKAAWLQKNQNAQVTIEGHCDERGTNEYNLALGDRRANSAKSYLMDLGIYGSRLNTISYGEERPADYGSNEESWAKNRRAHFTLE
ncbi:MAG: peptidoglycan-associated lipoprotein Pal [Desulfobacterales bacterium]|uniref:Peptidoglycan-associated lipoprotein n=1 Tax=Candidatus Desulfatibia vada TaxID=2841696 RepID=A0A8J6TU17_9BACT|nr:peptidoglycan-associated lipoprotein Pal [Candidatus Desulfatibia vada]